jgi:hypothetical protein
MSTCYKVEDRFCSTSGNFSYNIYNSTYNSTYNNTDTIDLSTFCYCESKNNQYSVTCQPRDALNVCIVRPHSHHAFASSA